MTMIVSGDHLEVVCEHPDYNSSFYSLTVEGYDLFASDDEVKEHKEKMLKEINHFVNPHGFWHTVKITQVFVIGDDIYRVVLQDE